MRILVDRFIYQGLRNVPSRRAVMAVTPWAWTVLGGLKCLSGLLRAMTMAGEWPMRNAAIPSPQHVEAGRIEIIGG